MGQGIGNGIARQRCGYADAAVMPERWAAADTPSRSLRPGCQNGPEWCWHRPSRARACQGRCQIVILHPPFVLSEGACMRFGPGTSAINPLTAPSHDPRGLPYRARRPCGKRAKRCTATRPLRNSRCRPKMRASIGAPRVDTPRRAAWPHGRLSQEPSPILGKDGRL